LRKITLAISLGLLDFGMPHKQLIKCKHLRGMRCMEEVPHFMGVPPLTPPFA